MKKIALLLPLLLLPFAFAHAEDAPLTRTELIDKLVAQGVPRRGVEMIYEFQDKNLGVPFVTDIYNCAGFPTDDARACRKKDRIFTTKTVVITDHEWAVYIDFKRPSREKRLWLLNLKTGESENEYVAHGSGSAKGPEPQRFSNRPDSRMTSLGFYVAGETYRSGNHGLVLRLHGLQRSNSNAYKRDVIFHGAKYAREKYLERINPKTKEPMDKIGESWGCPATSDAFAQKVIPLLKNGGLFFHDHEDLLDAAMTGEEVSLPAPAKK
jgi:hypothetical protein